MHPDCEDAIEQALGRSLRKGEANQIQGAISRNMRQLAQKDPQSWQALSSSERLEQGAKAAADEMVQAIKEKQRVVQLQIAAHDRVEGALNDAFEKLPDDAKPGAQLKAFSNLIGFDSTNRGRGLTSTETWADSIKHEALGNLVDVWKSIRGFMGLFEDKRAATDLVHEMFGEESGNPTAKAAVAQWIKVTNDLRDRANKSGANIGKLDDDDWHYPQSWSQDRIARAGRDVNESLQLWIDKTLPRLDRSRYVNEDGTRMSDRDMEDKVLRPAFDTLITDGQNKVEPGSGGYGNASGDLSGHRVLHFKDADSYLAAQGDFGEKNLWRAMNDHINRMSREIALRETLGPQHAQTFQYFNDRIRLDELRSNPQAKDTINSLASRNEALYDYVSGRHSIVDQRVANWGQAFRNFMVATKLGSVVQTALGDEAGMAATAAANKIPWTEVLQREATFANPANAEERAAAAHAGLGIETILGGLNRFGTEDFNLRTGVGLSGKAREFTAKLAAAQLKYSGASPMWDLRRRALGSVLMSYLGKTVRDVPHFADLNESDHGILARKGFSENDWQVMKLAKPEDWGAAGQVLTPKAIRDIPDAQLKPLGDPESLRRHASSMLLGHVLEETGMGVMTQGARERAWAAGFGTRGGTATAVAGELARSAMLFKGFSVSMMNKHWTRANSLEGSGATAAYYGRLFTIGTIAGATALTLQALSRGENPPNTAEPEFWAKAILKGGGLGFYGDFLGEATSSYDTPLVSALMGPVATTGQDVINLTLGAAIKKAQDPDKPTDERAKLIRFARGNNPLNMWYTKAAFDHLIWNDFQDAVSPGYLDRMQERAQRERGTSWYWDPHERLPNAAPDLGTMWQPERGAEQLEKIGDVAKAAVGQE
jgi:hypothetical protein